MSSSLPVSHVKISSQCARALVSHALTTENEEVLGLLLGHYVDKDEDGIGGSVIVCSTHILRRHDKRPDRVEVTASDLSLASQHAESVGLLVVGWYHSHPHITLHPSHVDLRTQHLYQYLNERFIGIIVSCFNKSKNEIGMLAFQSFEKKSKHIGTINKLSKYQNNEVNDTYKLGSDKNDPILQIKPLKVPIIYKDRDSMFLMDDDIKRELERFGDYDDHDQDKNTEVNLPIIIIDDMMDIQKELIIHDRSLEKMIDVIHILYQEEKESFLHSISGNDEKDTSQNLFVKMHHSAVYQKSLCRILEYIVFPYIRTLKNRKEEIDNEIKRIKEEGDTKSQKDEVIVEI